MEDKDLIKAVGSPLKEIRDKKDINEHIEDLTNKLSSTIQGIALNPDERKLVGYEIGMYSYLRDSHNTKTVGEAMLTLEQRKIDPKIVKLWIEERMALNNTEFDAISKGYPEFQQDLERVKTDHIEAALKRLKCEH